MPRWAWALMGSSGCWLLAGAAAVAVAGWYERASYPPEPDPVHFDVGGVFLLCWFALWVAGTLGVLYVTARSPRPPAG